MYEIYADGQLWIDSDGFTEFGYEEALSLVESLEVVGGYEVEMVKVY